jgi:ubiquinone/menaquinone biosynthesis C-methylase UbiE
VSQKREIAVYFDKHAYVIKIYSERSEPHVLELGIGTGKLSSYLLGAHDALRLTGIDVSRRMLEYAGRARHCVIDISRFSVEHRVFCEKKDRAGQKACPRLS